MSVRISQVDMHPERSVLVGHLAHGGLVDVYHKYFDYRIVRSEADHVAAHQLRYEVYCEETGYLSKDINPAGLERDEHDAHSVQSVLLHRASNRVAGTVRMVLPRPSKTGCAQPARLFSPVLNALPESVLPCKTTGEVSRFAIHPSFRRRLGDGLYARIFSGDELTMSDFDPRRVIPHITLGLFASIFQIVRENRLTHLCAVIDPGLLRILSRLGLHFHKAGSAIEFHGTRQPVYASGEELLVRLAEDQPAIYELIVAGDMAI